MKNDEQKKYSEFKTIDRVLGKENLPGYLQVHAPRLGEKFYFATLSENERRSVTVQGESLREAILQVDNSFSDDDSYQIEYPSWMEEEELNKSLLQTPGLGLSAKKTDQNVIEISLHLGISYFHKGKKICSVYEPTFSEGFGTLSGLKIPKEILEDLILIDNFRKVKSF